MNRQSVHTLAWAAGLLLLVGLVISAPMGRVAIVAVVSDQFWLRRYYRIG